MLIFDIDGAAGDALQKLRDRVLDDRILAIAYSSPSDALGSDRYRARLVLPLAAPCPGQWHRALWSRVNAELAIPASDTGCSDAGRIWFTLRADIPGRRRWLRVLAGGAFDPRPWIDQLADEHRQRERERQQQADWPGIVPYRPRRRYASAALNNGCNRVLGASEGDRHRTLLLEALALHGLALAGDLDSPEVDRRLAEAGREALPQARHREVARTLRWARAHAEPRDRRHG